MVRTYNFHAARLKAVALTSHQLKITIASIEFANAIPNLLRWLLLVWNVDFASNVAGKLLKKHLIVWMKMTLSRNNVFQILINSNSQ